MQAKLEALKDEKHRLFQQLKTVLNEEDEKKKIKEQEQKQGWVYVIEVWVAWKDVQYMCMYNHVGCTGRRKACEQIKYA